MADYKVPTLENYQFQPSVIDKDLSAPPATTKGNRYIVAATGSGAWIGHTGDIAIGNGSGWDFITKAEGLICWVEDENLFYLYDGSNWVVFDHTKIHTQNTDNKIIVNDTNVEISDMGGGDEQILFQENNAEIMRIRNGKVGILNNNPQEAVDVTGNIKLSGHQVGGDGTINPTNLLSNGNFENWTAGTSVAPDGWTLIAGTIAREASTIYKGTYSAKLTRVAGGGNQGNFRCDFLASAGGVGYVKSRTYTFSCWVWCDTANRARLDLIDGITDNYSAYHPGDSAWHLLSKTYTFASNASAAFASIYLDTAECSAYFDGAMCVEGESIFAFCEKPVIYNDNRFRVYEYGEFDISTASGDMVIVGVGFKPSGFIMLISSNSAANYFSIGICDGTDYNTISSSGTLTMGIASKIARIIITWDTVMQSAVLKSMNADGFTLTWTKAGSPTGTARITFLVFR